MKILIINTQSVNHSNATGVTLRSILRGKPSRGNFRTVYAALCEGSGCTADSFGAVGILGMSCADIGKPIQPGGYRNIGVR